MNFYSFFFSKKHEWKTKWMGLQVIFRGFLCWMGQVQLGTTDFWCLVYIHVRTRNWMEMNSLLVCFIESNLITLDDHQVQLLSSLLETHSDVVLYPWLAGKSPLPSEMLKNEMMIMLLRYVNPQHPSLKMNVIPWELWTNWEEGIETYGFHFPSVLWCLKPHTYLTTLPEISWCTRDLPAPSLPRHVEPNTWATRHGLDYHCLGAANSKWRLFSHVFFEGYARKLTWQQVLQSETCALWVDWLWAFLSLKISDKRLKRENIREVQNEGGKGLFRGVLATLEIRVVVLPNPGVQRWIKESISMSKNSWKKKS